MNCVERVRVLRSKFSSQRVIAPTVETCLFPPVLITFVLNYPFTVFIYSGAQKLEEAVDLYHRSANMFKMAKKWNGE